MHLLDSRRLTGPNLLLDRAGAVLEVALTPAEAEGAVAAWKAMARRLLDGVGWEREEIAARLTPGGAVLALTAPIDALYAATEVNEAAWAAVEGGAMVYPQEVERLREEIAREARPSLRALRDAAAARGVSCLWDDRQVSVGTGTGSFTWPADALPSPSEIDWEAVHDVPLLLVTGTNGKTTTVRLLASILTVAGHVVGTTSTDRIEVAAEVIERGDFSGPGGARTLLRDRRVEVAVLETARGGLLRRGLAVEKATAALVTNIAADHLGEMGVFDLPSLAAAKLVITRAIGPEGRVVLNAEDPELVAASEAIGAPITWFGLDPTLPRLREGDAVYLEDGFLVLSKGGNRTRVVPVAELPFTWGGAARHNVANALGAIGLAAALPVPLEAISIGLRRIGGTPEDNEGRANLLERDGVRIIVDYAHNPHGLTALLDFSRSLPAERRLLMIGQAGDRDDAAIRELARVAWSLRPNRVLVKEMTEMLRGRPPGEVADLLSEAFWDLGARPEAVTRVPSELSGVEEALAWAQPGDLLVLLVHTDRDAVISRLRS